MELKVIRQDGELTHLALIGRLDLETVFGLQAKFTTLTAARRKPALIDLSEVDYLPSVGLRMLLSAAQALDKYGSKMVLLNPQPPVEEVLKISGLDKIMPISHDMVKAMDLLRIT
jgi:anti-sigma B factor antagonist